MLKLWWQYFQVSSWLQIVAHEQVLPQTLQPDNDSVRHVLIPSWRQLHIGSAVDQSSHQLRSIRDIAVCAKCGHFGSEKLVRLPQQCRMRSATSSSRHLMLLMSAPESNQQGKRSAANKANAMAVDQLLDST